MNKTGEISNNFLALLVVVAIAVALAGFMLPAKLTGYGVTGTLAADLNSTTAINFSDASIDFGAVAVPEGMTSCTIDSEDVTTCTADAPDNGFTVENIGNNNVSLDLKTGKNAATLLGGTSPAYKWKVTEKEPGACTSAAGSYVDVNTTSPGTRICGDFVKTLSTDEIYIDVQLTVPSDAVPGAKSDTFTATATG
jgi:hypothetical protein